MGKYKEIAVKESRKELKVLMQKNKFQRVKIRIQSLILTQEKRFKTREQLANHLGVGLSSLNRWTKNYQENGLEAMLAIKSGGNRESKISEKLHQSMEQKVNDSSDPLLGYWDAVRWAREEHGVEIKYTTLRSYLIRKFGTKLKSPRKSHYKKDERKVDVFLKLS